MRKVKIGITNEKAWKLVQRVIKDWGKSSDVGSELWSWSVGWVNTEKPSDKVNKNGVDELNNILTNYDLLETKTMKMTKTKLREIIRQSIVEEREYDKYFKGMLAKYGVDSPADLSDEEKSKFFTDVDKGWTAKNEELTGNQHKLDVDGDGEIDASDLAALRASKNEYNLSEFHVTEDASDKVWVVTKNKGQAYQISRKAYERDTARYHLAGSRFQANRYAKQVRDDMKNKSINESNYDLMFGKMGNGITVSNKKVTDPNTKDYKFIAHISDSGKIDWKDDEAKNNAKVRREVEKRAKSWYRFVNESDDYSSKINEAKQYDIGMGRLGNGITVYNRAETDPNTKDYKFIAHISNSGKIDWKDKEAQKLVTVRREVEEKAKSMNENRNPAMETKFYNSLKPGQSVKYTGPEKNGFKKGETYKVDNVKSSSTFEKTVVITDGSKKLIVKGHGSVRPVNESDDYSSKINEGNAFGMAVTQAKKEGKTEFEFNGKTYKVKKGSYEKNEAAKEAVNEIDYKTAITSFNTDLENNKEVKALAKHYNKSVKDVVKSIQLRMVVNKYNDKSVKSIKVNFKDVGSGITVTHSKEYGKNEAAKETVNESVSVFDERHFGKKGIIIMIDDGGKKVSAIFKDKKNADKYNRNNPSDVKNLLDLAKKTPYPKAIDESINESTKFYAFFNGKKHEIEGTSLWDAKQKAITQLKVPKSKVGLLAIVNASDHNKGSFKFD
jgi:hypothetical protein